jgi:hypothetical protein
LTPAVSFLNPLLLHTLIPCPACPTPPHRRCPYPCPPTQPPTYFFPAWGAYHFLACFAPMLLAPGVWARERRAGAALTIATGPLLTSALTRRFAGATWRLEWPAIWCLVSVAHCLLALGIERVSGMDGAARDGASAARYAKLAAAGALWGGPAQEAAAPASPAAAAARPSRAAAAGAAKRRAAAAAAAQAM